MVTIDIPHIFRTFGGIAGLLKALDRWQPGHGITYNTVQMWNSRGRIPAPWLGPVFYCIERAGWTVNEFLIDEDLLRINPAPGQPRRGPGRPRKTQVLDAAHPWD